MEKGINITVSKDCHKLVVEHLKDTASKIGKWTELAIKEKMQVEKSTDLINAAFDKNIIISNA